MSFRELRKAHYCEFLKVRESARGFKKADGLQDSSSSAGVSDRQKPEKLGQAELGGERPWE